jgi:hypothetical protein
LESQPVGKNNSHTTSDLSSVFVFQQKFPKLIVASINATYNLQQR